MSRPLPRGFTLIELLMVIIIIAVMSSLLVPAYGRFWDRTRFEGGVAAVRDLLTYAREQAIANDTTATVTFDPQQGALAVTVAPPPPPTDQPVALGGAGALDAVAAAPSAPAPRGLALREELAIARLVTGEGTNGMALHFHGDGSNEGAVVTVVSQSGYMANVVVAPSTGRVTVDDSAAGEAP